MSGEGAVQGMQLRLELPPGAPDELERTRAPLADVDIRGQLLERRGTMRELGSEGGDPKLDWVDGVELALRDRERLAECEREARDILARGIRHVIWAGMGGSVQTVYVLSRLGLLDHPKLSIHPCDGTDPATLNRILLEVARAEGIAPDPAAIVAALPDLLARTMMIGVSMGMTSEEPITHLEWFDRLLIEHGVPDRAGHIEVMTLPGSYLDRFAEARGCTRVPLQLDGASRTGGRMSAPATRVFIRPVALRLVADALERDPSFVPRGALLEAVFSTGQAMYGVASTLDAPARRALVRSSPFVRLGALISNRAHAGSNQVALAVGTSWRGFEPWLEQLVEESLGKGGKGFCLFYGDQPWSRLRTGPLVLRLGGGDGGPGAAPAATLALPEPADLEGRLGLLAGLFGGFKLTISTFGYLQGIVFAGQPAVEAYNAYARQYRDAPGDVSFGGRVPPARTGVVQLDVSSLGRGPGIDAGTLRAAVEGFGGDPADAGDLLGAVLLESRRRDFAGRQVGYLDFTFNGELTEPLERVLEEARRALAHGALAVPAKLRTGPSDYHATEQREVDGPAELVSLRMVALCHDAPLAGEYSDKFLLAQARGTWQAMEDAGRWVVMLTMPRLDAASLADLERVFARAAARLA
jgi:hypothetical protein